MMSFTIAHASVVILRVRQPDAERPYRMGGNVRVRGYEIPVGAVVGGIGTFATWVSLIVLHGDARYIGAGWLTVGIVGYLLYRRRLGLDPRITYRLEHRRPPAWFKELEYGSALVPLFSTDVDGSALRAAAKLVGPDAVVDCVYVLRVPSHLPLDARLDDEEQIGRSVCEAARLAGRRAGVKKVQTRLLRARNPGAALVEEAQRNRSEIIYLGTTHAPPSERALGPLATYLLAKRPCRIVVESGPGQRGAHVVGAGRDGAGPEADLAARNGERVAAPS
jgi:APA family basic amino acid/polyamine antiporter